VCIDVRGSLAAGWWKVSQEHDDRPKLIITESAFGAGHTRRPDAVIENPFELAIGITLNMLRGERRDGWRHVIDEWDTCVLPVHAMASDTVMRECLFAVVPGIAAIGQRIFLLLVAYQEMVLRKVHRSLLKLAGRRSFAADYANESKREGAAENRGHVSSPRALSESSRRDPSHKKQSSGRQSRRFCLV